jgi:hypothetical protein
MSIGGRVQNTIVKTYALFGRGKVQVRLAFITFAGGGSMFDNSNALDQNSFGGQVTHQKSGINRTLIVPQQSPVFMAR